MGWPDVAVEGELSEIMTFVAPFSDAVDALRALKLLFVETYGEISAWRDAHRLQAVKSNLREFYFPPDGMRGVLLRIVEHDAKADFAELRRQFRETDGAVAGARRGLQRHRGRLGATSLEALEAVLLLQDGKSGLRQEIERLISSFLATSGDGAEVRATAKALVTEIEEFNQELIALHDALDPNGPSFAPRV